MTAVVSAVVASIISKGKTLKNKHNQDAEEFLLLKKGVQALLRDKLYYLNDKGIKEGSVTVAEKNNFENIWNSYHNLGANGVMDSIHKDYMELPIKTKGE